MDFTRYQHSLKTMDKPGTTENDGFIPPREQVIKEVNGECSGDERTI